ncbi:A/G-specific adenine glycosylase [Campylobacter insulaenigrae]|uniref:A/G-specific adenine glycosylase n=1 Tax=Campylobacter insulaenigrae TaxID=260714 RepID=UPI0021528BD6|nr:A/G-specific adenine glycosylase [Campylobacter insulaenigrae]MCR6570666.1 A/G-specific adenine glycosylase [Campylobacter insulaenigrae]
MEQIHQNILQWYKDNGRKDLPWRTLHDKFKIYAKKEYLLKLKNIDPAYGVYISEIMLQQTQVKSVLQNYYFQFLEKFNSLEKLAKAKEEEILKAWQGLGYYTRARNLYKSAQICVKEFDSKLPSDIQNLKKLPGIGDYSAGAIACFGFLQNEAFVDANIKRVLIRFYKLNNPTPKILIHKAKELLNHFDAFTHNQALLDIGALICLPKNARCDKCPLYKFCEAKFDYEKYNIHKKINYEKLNLNLLVLKKHDFFVLKKSQEKLYFNMYNFLEFRKHKNAIYIGSFKHSYTKYKIEAKVYFLQDDMFEIQDEELFTYEKLQKIALSKFALKALDVYKKSL